MLSTRIIVASAEASWFETREGALLTMRGLDLVLRSIAKRCVSKDEERLARVSKDEAVEIALTGLRALIRPRPERITAPGDHFWLPLAALRVRPAALPRKRAIWPLGRVTQISPIHSSLTPLIGLALKLVRLTTAEELPRSMVFR